MSLPTVSGVLDEGVPFFEPQPCLTSNFALAYYQFYLTGTTTPANVYQNGNLTSAFGTTGRVTANAYGRFPAIYLDTSVTYRVRLYNSAGVQQWQQDPYVAPLSTVGTSSLSSYGLTIAPTGEVTVPAPNAGGSGVTLTLDTGALGTAALKLAGTLPGTSALIVNSSATTGAQTATFTATNKPGTATSAPAGWLPITCDGVQYYTPIWHGNPFTPYAASPGALGEAISGNSVTFGGNGVTTVSSGSATPGNWFSPTTTNVGAGYYLNITRTGGTAGVNFSAAQGAWTLIGAGGLTVTSSPSGAVNGTYQISNNSTGTPVVAGGSISITPLAVVRAYVSGSGTETVPSGTSNVRVEVWGSGGGGGGGAGLGSPGFYGGGGGLSVSSYTAAALGGSGGTFTYNVSTGGAGGGVGVNGTAGSASTVVAGTVTGFTSMTGNGGAGGAANGAGGNGAGGTATGGNASNTTGPVGTTVGLSGTVSGDGSPYGGGGMRGGNSNGSIGQQGQNGAVVFYYT